MKYQILGICAAIALGMTGCGGSSDSGDDSGSDPVIAIADVSIIEGNSGTSNLTFPVTLSFVSSTDITVTYKSADDTALVADNDYTATSGTLTILAGSTSGTINVPVIGDITLENDETMTVTISAPTNAILGNAAGTGTITTDDFPQF